MKDLLFSINGRANRAKYWLTLLIQLVVMALSWAIMAALWQVIPGEYVNGEYSVEGVRAIPYLVVGFATIIVIIWSGIAIGIKRCHDRDRSGWFLLIQLIPIVGPIWLFIELAILSGTAGPNRFGPDPLGRDPA